MIFVFENKKDDLLSVLFRASYSNCSFIYANGCGNLESCVEDNLSKSDDSILVFLDTIPDNKNTVNIYKNLRRLSRKNDFRIVVMPIVCAEYYFIRSLRREYFIDDTGVDICINKMFWKNSALVSDSDRKFVKNFEKYCKLILFKSVKDCIKHTRYEDNSNSL